VDLTLTDVRTVAGAAAIVAILVQLLKPWIPERLVPVAAVVAGVAVSVAATLAQGVFTAEQIGNAVLTGLLAGACAVGLYQLQRPLSLLPPKS
jgi:hypothetical protein